MARLLFGGTTATRSSGGALDGCPRCRYLRCVRNVWPVFSSFMHEAHFNLVSLT